MVKVELLKDEKTGHVRFAFESSNEDGLETIDLLRVAMLGDFPKQGGYVSSNRLIVEIQNVLTKEKVE